MAREEPQRCETQGCVSGTGEIIVDKHDRTRVVCPACMDELVGLSRWVFTGLLDRSDRLSFVA